MSAHPKHKMSNTRAVAVGNLNMGLLRARDERDIDRAVYLQQRIAELGGRPIIRYGQADND
jgi:hypothetical protein